MRLAVLAVLLLLKLDSLTGEEEEILFVIEDSTPSATGSEVEELLNDETPSGEEHPEVTDVDVLVVNEEVSVPPLDSVSLLSELAGLEGEIVDENLQAELDLMISLMNNGSLTINTTLAPAEEENDERVDFLYSLLSSEEDKETEEEGDNDPTLTYDDLLAILPEEEKNLFLDELLDRDPDPEEGQSEVDDYLMELLPEHERELLVSEIMAQESLAGETAQEGEEEDVLQHIPDVEKEVLYSELFAHEITTDSDFQLLSSEEKELLLSEILRQETSTTEGSVLVTETAPETDILELLPEDERELLQILDPEGDVSSSLLEDERELVLAELLADKTTTAPSLSLEDNLLNSIPDYEIELLQAEILSQQTTTSAPTSTDKTTTTASISLDDDLLNSIPDYEIELLQAEILSQETSTLASSYLDEVVFNILPDDEKEMLLSEIFDQETTSAPDEEEVETVTEVSNPPLVEDLYDSILEAEKELLLTELLSYENTTSSTVLDDDISNAPEGEVEMLLAEILSQETTTTTLALTFLEEEVFNNLPDSEKELLLDEILSRETTKEPETDSPSTLTEEEVFDVLPESERELLLAEMLVQMTTSPPAEEKSDILYDDIQTEDYLTFIMNDQTTSVGLSETENEDKFFLTTEKLSSPTFVKSTPSSTEETTSLTFSSSDIEETFILTTEKTIQTFATETFSVDSVDSVDFFILTTESPSLSASPSSVTTTPSFTSETPSPEINFIEIEDTFLLTTERPLLSASSSSVTTSSSFTTKISSQKINSSDTDDIFILKTDKSSLSTSSSSLTTTPSSSKETSTLVTSSSEVEDTIIFTTAIASKTEKRDVDCIPAQALTCSQLDELSVLRKEIQELRELILSFISRDSKYCKFLEKYNVTIINTTTSPPSPTSTSSSSPTTTTESWLGETEHYETLPETSPKPAELSDGEFISKLASNVVLVPAKVASLEKLFNATIWNLNFTSEDELPEELEEILTTLSAEEREAFLSLSQEEKELMIASHYAKLEEDDGDLLPGTATTEQSSTEAEIVWLVEEDPKPSEVWEYSKELASKVAVIPSKMMFGSTAPPEVTTEVSSEVQEASEESLVFVVEPSTETVATTGASTVEQIVFDIGGPSTADPETETTTDVSSFERAFEEDGTTQNSSQFKADEIVFGIETTTDVAFTESTTATDVLEDLLNEDIEEILSASTTTSAPTTDTKEDHSTSTESLVFIVDDNEGPSKNTTTLAPAAHTTESLEFIIDDHLPTSTTDEEFPAPTTETTETVFVIDHEEEDVEFSVSTTEELVTTEATTEGVVVPSKEIDFLLDTLGNETFPDSPEPEISTSTSVTSTVERLPEALRLTRPEQCLTVGGPEPLAGCVFPFIYRRRTYSSCTAVNTRGRPWCTTRLDSRGRYIRGSWGYCNDNCHIVGVSTSTLTPQQTSPKRVVTEPIITFEVTTSEDPLAFLSPEEREIIFLLPPSERELILSSLEEKEEEGGTNNSALDTLNSLALQLQNIKLTAGEEKNSSDSLPTGRMSGESDRGDTPSTTTTTTTTTENFFQVVLPVSGPTTSVSSSQSPLSEVIDELSFFLGNKESQDQIALDSLDEIANNPSEQNTFNSSDRITFSLSEEEQLLLDSLDDEEKSQLLSVLAENGVDVSGLSGGQNDSSVTIQLNQSLPLEEIQLLTTLLANQSTDSGDYPSMENSTQWGDLERDFIFELEEETCSTVGGADVDKDCVFPFIFQGRNFTGCTFHFGVGEAWCSTETDSAGNYQPGRWGYCSPACPLHHLATRECVTVSGPATGQICVFPFLHQEVFHWGCTERDGGYWCPTRLDDHAELDGDNWGWCRERCREEEPQPCQSQQTTTGTSLSDNVNRFEKSFEVTPPPVQNTTLVYNESEILQLLPEEERLRFLEELLGQETSTELITTPAPDIFNLLPDGEKELLLAEILEQEYTDGDSLEDNKDVYDLLPDSERELLFSELLAQETTTSPPDIFEILPEEEKELLLAEILAQEEKPETSTLSDDDIFAALPEEERELLASLLLSEATSTAPATCLSSDTCQGRCGGGSDLNCWCDAKCTESGDCCCDYQDICLPDHASPQELVQTNVTSPKPLEISLCRDAGSCQGRCGGGSDVDCWCDDLCQQYGDCCCDLDSSCRDQDLLNSPLQETCSQAGSCEGRCDDGSDGDCWCDDHCPYHGDCCCDRQTFCPPENTNTTTTSEIVFSDTTTVFSSTLPETTTVVEESSSSETTTVRSGCWCSTNGEGPVVGECCVFPFLYKSESHHSCVEVEDGRSWCSTAVDGEGGYVPGQWGFCGDNCFFETPTPPTPGTEGTVTTETVRDGKEEIYVPLSTVAVLDTSTTGTTPTVTTSKSTTSRTETTSVLSTSSPTSSSSVTTESSPPSTTTPTTTVSTPSTTTTTTPRPIKVTPEFLQTLPPTHSVVFIHKDLHDPVRDVLSLLKTERIG